MWNQEDEDTGDGEASFNAFFSNILFYSACFGLLIPLLVLMMFDINNCYQ